MVFRPSPFSGPLKHSFDHLSRHRVNDQLVAVIGGFQISIGCPRTDIFSIFHSLPLLRFYLFRYIQRVGFVNHVPQRDDDAIVGMIREEES